MMVLLYQSNESGYEWQKQNKILIISLYAVVCILSFAVTRAKLNILYEADYCEEVKLMNKITI